MSLPGPRALSVLTIAGSDSGGGAGIQADLKTFPAHGLHGLSAIAALTAQNTRGVTAVHVPPKDFLHAQIDAYFDDFRIGAVKLGMLANRQVIDAVADALERHRPAFIVLDPVMVATSRARLLEPDALDALRTRLFPLATILTPNMPEAGCCSASVSMTMQPPRPHWKHCERWARKPCCSRWALAERQRNGRSLSRWSQESPVHTRANRCRGTRHRLHARVGDAANLCRGQASHAACEAATDYVQESILRKIAAAQPSQVLPLG